MFDLLIHMICFWKFFSKKEKIFLTVFWVASVCICAVLSVILAALKLLCFFLSVLNTGSGQHLPDRRHHCGCRTYRRM